MDFTSDWHSMHIPLWQEHLGPLNGRPVRCVEIGSHEGRSAAWIVQHLLSHPDSSLTCIDPWPNPEAERRFDANLAETGRAGQVRKFKTESSRALPLLTPGFEFAYVDGLHEGRHVLEDAIHAFRLVKVGGLVIFDDYRNRPPAAVQPPQPAIDTFLLFWSDCLELLHQGEQVIVRKTREPPHPTHNNGTINAHASPPPSDIFPPRRATRFVVLSQLCTASSLLCESIRRHPQILMHGEILNQNYKRHELPSDVGSDRFRAALSATTHDAIGCKLHAGHPNPGFEHWESAWEELFADPTIKIVQLTRQNTLAQLAAWKIAGMLGGPMEQANAIERPVVQIDPGELAWFRRWQTMTWQVRLARLKRHAILPITFESLYDNWSATVESILQFIGVEPLPLEPCEPWRETRPLEQIVTNYAELAGNQ